VVKTQRLGVPGTILALLLVAACSGKQAVQSGEAGAKPAAQEQINPGPAWPAVALLQTGDNPLWFELRPAGPSLIDSPAAASLTPFTPWPYARFVSGMMVWDGFLVMAINRDGFLVLGSTDDSAAAMLYRAPAGGLWDSYTAESLFLWKDKPAVLLYRNDFFAEPAAPSPKPQVYTLDSSSPVPLGAAVPALESFPSDGPWEAETVQRGPDGFWYYRMKEKGLAQNETAYFRTANLGEIGTKISVGEWRNSDLPEGPEKAPPVLLTVLRNAQPELDHVQGGAGRFFVIRAVSTDFEGARFFGSVKVSALTETENSQLLYGYCRQTPEPLALAILGDGRGLYSFGPVGKLESFSLPALPDGFAYTGVALLGDVLAASWEEQQEAGIGAAGFMVMQMKMRN